MEFTVKLLVFFIAVMIIGPSVFTHSVDASAVPDWIKNTAKWYGDGDIPEDDFLNAIKYLIQQKIIIISESGTTTNPNIVIPNGNSEKGSHGFYEPMHLDITKETVVIWENQDDYGHTIQSQDNTGNVIPIFNSNILLTGQTFEHKFTENGDYQYFCTLHPWRVGTISVI